MIWLRRVCVTDVPSNTKRIVKVSSCFGTLFNSAESVQCGPKSKGSDSPSLVKPIQSLPALCCSWCKRYGHTDAQCWRRFGLCLICGGTHRMSSCTRYIPSAASVKKPVRSSCSGDHLGRNCLRIKQRTCFRHCCG